MSEEGEIKTVKKEVGWAVGKGLWCMSELKNNYFTSSVMRSVTFRDASVQEGGKHLRCW